MLNPSAVTVAVSPCINICELDAAERCVGCGRSLAEIAEWSMASNARRLQICDQARRRLAEIDDGSGARLRSAGR